MLKANRVQRRLSLQFTYPQSNTYAGRRANLRVTDEASSLVLFEAELIGDQVLDMIANSTVYLDAEMLEDLGRIGQQRECESTTIGFRDADGNSWTEEGVRVHAETWRQANGFDTVDVNRIGGAGGWRLLGRRWVDADKTKEG